MERQTDTHEQTASSLCQECAKVLRGTSLKDLHMRGPKLKRYLYPSQNDMAAMFHSFLCNTLFIKEPG
jgi:hypothetical protein